MPRPAVPERFARDARLVTAPVLFHLQWDDEIFPGTASLPSSTCWEPGTSD